MFDSFPGTALSGHSLPGQNIHRCFSLRLGRPVAGKFSCCS